MSSLALERVRANTPTPIWKRTAPVTFMARRCWAEILEVAQFFSLAPQRMAGCTLCSIASPVALMEASRTNELPSIAKVFYTAEKLQAVREAVKVAVVWFAS